jgi:nicotinamide mononucleotide (NMN) deamidase PncC
MAAAPAPAAAVSPSFESLLPSFTTDFETMQTIKTMAHKSAYELLSELNSRATKDRHHQICTSESLTAGLIMATLVDIPWAGYLKYGCFGVYDTDAKRVFNHVSVDDVYTHQCAKEMAVGILRNSNATLGIAVTGNAMPLNDHADMVGEVFIGIAGYNSDGNIIYSTKSINTCEDTMIESFKDLCKKWYTTIVRDKKYNPRDQTALMSQEIRHYTAHAALQYCLEFVKIHNPIIPNFVIERKNRNNEKTEMNHTDIPPNRFSEPATEICVDDPCNDTKAPKTRRFSFGGRRRRTNRRPKTRA